jgi:poly-gamma-glutamate synthesis protein (capsule biosynthesis protein)
MDAVGDIIAGDHPHFLGIGVGSAVKNGLYVFEHVEKVFAKADIVFGNLETILSDYGKTNSYESLILRGKPDFIEQLKRAHFSVLNVANNHIQQHGKQCLFDTVSVLQQNGIRVVGIDNLQPQIISSKGIKLGFFGYSLRHEEYNSKVLYSQGNKKKIISEINKVKKKVDYIIISLHWGDEYINLPSISQISFAHDIIDAGADIILGHHPHVSQPVEKYKGGIIAYSLGNFVSDMCSEITKKSMILKIIFKQNQINKVELIPIYINKNYQPEISTNKEIKKYSYNLLQTEELLNLVKSTNYKETLKNSIWNDRHKYFKFLIRNFYKFSISVLYKIIYNAIKRRYHNER